MPEPTLLIRQPLPHDLVDDPIKLCGIGTAFEATVNARVRDATGTELAFTHFMAGGTGIFANFQTTVTIGSVPSTPQGTLEVFEISARDGSEIAKVVIPVVFGRALLDPYHGFTLHTVAPGETLSSIAQQWYSDSTVWARIFEANRLQIANPDLIFPGQVLRIPQ